MWATRLSEQEKQQFVTLGRLGWTKRQIQKPTGVQCETAFGYLRTAGIPVAEPARAITLVGRLYLERVRPTHAFAISLSSAHNVAARSIALDQILSVSRPPWCVDHSMLIARRVSRS